MKRNSPLCQPVRQRGLSLPELLTTIAVLGITTTAAVPAMNRMVADHRAATQVNALVGAMALARSEAVSTASRVAVCPYADNGAALPAERYTCRDAGDWSGGWMVYRELGDEAGVPTGEREIVRVVEPTAGAHALQGPAQPLVFLPTGFLDSSDGGAAAEPEFMLRPVACAATTVLRRITVSLQGQSRIGAGSSDDHC